MSADKATGFPIGGVVVPPGAMWQCDLSVARLPIQKEVSLPMMILHGARPGARVWINAAIHGDELSGLQIVWRVLDELDPSRMAGTVVMIPVVNLFGFLDQSRYLPDRRDLNRCFPGGPRGSLGSRLAHLFMVEVVAHCTHGIDLHTAAVGRENYPQVRGDLDHPETRRIAEAFGAPVMLHAKQRPGSLRATARTLGTPVIVYEGGRPQTFDEDAILAGTQGVLRVLRTLGVTKKSKARSVKGASLEVRKVSWIRARRAGLLRLNVHLGDRVKDDQHLGIIADLFGKRVADIKAPFDGVVIGRTTNPVVYQGDALVNVGRIEA